MIHILLNGYDVSHVEHLAYLIHGRPLWDRIVRELNLPIVSQIGHSFDPGYSYTYLLSEGHMMIHTYPDRRSFYMDLFYPHQMPSEVVNIVQRVWRGQVTYRVIPR
jgi:S-adenosylmethionine/arginine decarboxylase-like enzyme